MHLILKASIFKANWDNTTFRSKGAHITAIKRSLKKALMYGTGNLKIRP